MGEGADARTIVRPALSNSVRTVIAGMADVYGYAHQVRKDEPSVLTLRCSDGSIECGCRFKHIPNEITTNYHELVKALQSAIDKEATETGGKFVTDEKIIMPVAPTYDFDALTKEFQELVGELMTANQSNSNKITAIVERYLGKGKKVAECAPEQSEQLDLIVSDLKALLKG